MPQLCCVLGCSGCYLGEWRAGQGVAFPGAVVARQQQLSAEPTGQDSESNDR